MRPFAIVAWIIALTGLAWLGWVAWHPLAEAKESVTEITLWTPGSSPSASAPDPTTAGLQLALSGAERSPPGVSIVPDVAYLRRTFPQLRTVHLVGDGVDAPQAAALRGLLVTWPRPTLAAQPTITFLSAARSLTIGEPLTVQGRVEGLPTNSSLTLTLESPDGSTENAELKATSDGSGAFSLTSKAAVAPGTFEWTLRLGQTGEPVRLGATVTPPTLPRVLLLQASPNVEATRLQRWLAESGAAVTSRTRVSAENYRFASANEAPAEVAVIDATLLTKFDVIVTTESALSELAATQRSAVQDAVKLQGLGLLVLGEPASAKLDDFFAPWPGIGTEKSAAEKDARSTRLHLSADARFEGEAAVLPGELPPLALARTFIRDSSNRTLAAVVPRGRGSVARSLVVETWHWLQEGRPELFATYWSRLLSAVARPLVATSGSWRLENPSLSAFVNEPVFLTWSGPPESRPKETWIESAAGGRVPLVLSDARADATEVSLTFWPTQPGWQHLRSAEGQEAFSFYVQPTSALPGLKIAERHRVTAQLVAESPAVVGARPESKDAAFGARERSAPRVAFLLFLLGAGYLWIDQRRRTSAR